MEQDFASKTAIVTGAGSGIGKAIALELAARGAAVVAADIAEDDAKAVAGLIKEQGGKAGAFTCNVAKDADCARMAEFAAKTFGGLQLAVNNAGIGGASADVGGQSHEDWDRVIAVNLTGVFNCMRHQLPLMEKAGGGAIVNMSSILGSVGFANASAYVAAKHGVVGLTKTAAMEYANRKIRINAVGPAFIDTPLLTKHLDADMLKAIAAMHPVQRLGTSEEVSALTCFLLSDRASFITGSYHLADGAYTAQ